MEAKPKGESKTVTSAEDTDKKIAEEPKETEQQKPKETEKKIVMPVSEPIDIIKEENTVKDDKTDDKPVVNLTEEPQNKALEKSTEKTEINPPIKKEVTPEQAITKETEKEPKESSIPEAKEEKESIKQEDWRLERERLMSGKPRQKEKKKSLVLWYLGVAASIVVLIAIAVWYFYFRVNSGQKVEPIHEQTVKVETKTVTPQEDLSENSNKKEVSEKTTPEEKGEEVTENKPEAKTQEPAKQINKPVKTQSKSSAARIYERDINKPAIFIGCFAVKSESLAQKKVEQIKAQNLDAHYYWIPDLNEGGNQFFKVVVGPFNSITEAYPSLTKAQERVNFDSYILIIE